MVTDSVGADGDATAQSNATARRASMVAMVISASATITPMVAIARI